MLKEQKLSFLEQQLAQYRRTPETYSDPHLGPY